MTNAQIMIKKKVSLLLLLSGMSMASVAQELLTLEDVITISLENNHNIQLERYNVKMDENNVSRAIAGQMPRAEIIAGYEFGYADAETQTLGGGEGPNPPIELDGTSQDISLKAQVTMPIFDGFLGKYRFRQLQNAHTMSELKLLAVMEQTINSTVTNYLYAARLQAKLGIEAENMAISLDRLARIRTDATFGTANSIRQLQSLVDLNTDSANYQTTLIDYQSSLRNLNLLMARSSEVQFKVQESIELSETLDYDQLLEEMKISNTQLKLSGSGVDHAMYGMKISESNFLPKLNGYANLSYFDSEDDASFIQQNSVVGPNIGVSLNIPLFTGGANKIQKQNATVALEQQKTSQAQTSLSLETALRNDYSRYEMNKMRLRIERSNLQTFERNYEKTHEDYKLGLVDESDLRTAQLNLLAAKNRINDLTYQVKQSEVNLLQLSGRLAPTNKL